jgi:RHS repeat-associated protein
MTISQTSCARRVAVGLLAVNLFRVSVFAQSDADVSSKRVFTEPLIRASAQSDPDDNRALAAALNVHSRRQKVDDFSAPEQFLQSHPNSTWRVSLLTNLGVSYYKAGYFTKAMDTWEQAWKLGKDETDPAIYDVANRALGELAKMNARVGRADRVEALLQESRNRTIHGSTTELLTAAAEGPWLMKNRPDMAFRCGPFAVGKLYDLAHPRSAAPVQLQNAKSSKVGTSLLQARNLAASLGLNYQMAKRTPGAAIIIPAVVNWKAGHFATLVKKNANNRYVVQDATFGEDFWVTAAALDSEGSGYYLVPAGELPDGWQPVSDEEGSAVFGKGTTASTDPDPCGPCDPQTGGDCAGCGEGTPDVSTLAMARYSAHTSLISLHIADTPFFYTPPRGPAISFTVTYNQRDPNPDTTFAYSNFGPKWTFDWLSFVVDDSTNLGADVKIYLRGGGFRTHTGYDLGTQSYHPELYSQSTLVITNTNPITYEKRLTDGSKEVYSVSDGTVGPGRKVFLHQIVDSHGNALTINYDASMRISTVVDALGNATTLGYQGTSNKIVSITSGTTGSPSYRSASFDYDPTSGQLSKITDMAGIVSQFSYDTGLKSSFIKALTTPYGMSTFKYDDSDTDPNLYPRNRWLEMTDPMGGTERLEFTELVTPADATDMYYGQGYADPSVPLNLVPQGDIYTRDFVLQARNTFYWGKRAMMEMQSMPAGTPLDYSKAHIYHWLHYNGSQSGAVLESEKAPLENRIWYDYQGQSYDSPDPNSYDQGATLIGSGWGSNSPATGTALRTRVGRVLGDLNSGGVSQIYKNDYNSAGMVIRAVDPAGRTTTYSYDANGIDLLAVYQENPAGASTDDYGMAADKLASYTYNSLHEPLTSTDAAGQTTTNTYNAAGQILTRTVVRSGSNETTTWNYDSNGYLQSITGPISGSGESFTYDAFGRVGTQTDTANNYTLIFEYDALNRPTKVTYPDGTYEQTIYNRLDVEWKRDRQGRWTHYYHDALRRLAKVVDPLNRTTQYDWCACGALDGILDPKGNRTGFSYDVQSRLIQKQYADNTAITYAYEATTSRLKSATDAKSQVTNYSYNTDNTLAGVTYTGTNGQALNPSTPAVSYSYDPSYNRIASLSDGAGVSTYTYKPVTGSASLGAGRLQSLAHSPAAGQPSDYTISYSYDELGRVSSRSIDSGNTVSTSFDALKRVSSISNALGTFNYTYVGATGRLDHVDYPNAQKTQYAYFGAPADPRLQTINNLNFDGSTIISRFDYGYNAAGEITSWSQQRGNNSATANVHSFDYDLASQLQGDSVTLGGTGGTLQHQYAYRYDASGNRTSEQIDASVNQASHNNLNQLTGRSGGGQMAFEGNLSEPGTVTISGSAAQVDGSNHFKGTAAVTTGANSIPLVATDINGNVTSKTISVTVSGSASQGFSYDLNGNMTEDGSTGGNTYEWDAANRLVAINYMGTSKRTEFLYDGLSRRVRITERNNGNVTSLKNLIWDGMEIAEERDGSNTVTKRYFAQGCLNGTDKQYYARDHLGSVRDITNDTHAVTSSFDYDPWGRISLVSGTSYPDFGFTGHYFHSPSGLHLTLYRGYSAEAGRWISRDPVGEKLGFNLYPLVWNDVIRWIDPLGLGPEDPFHDAPINSKEGQIDEARALKEMTDALEGKSPYQAENEAAAAQDAANQASQAADRSLDDILKDDSLFNRWCKASKNPNNPLKDSDAQKVWNKLTQMGKNPRLDPAHPGTQWDTPHINADGMHIPVSPSFTPP